MKILKLFLCIVISSMVLTACNNDDDDDKQGATKPYVIGLDLGGTNSVFGIVDDKANVLETTVIKTGNYETAEEFVEAGVKALQPMIEKVGGFSKIQAMGIGAPAANYHTGTIEYAANLRWAKDRVVPLAKMFSESLNNLPVAMTNDANAAAIGEKQYGVARGMNDFIVITLGTGVGSGIVVYGQLLYGHDGFAGELGHVVIVRGEEGRPCGCGRSGCLECYCSASGVARTAREWLAASDRPSLLRQLDPEKITSKDISEAAEKGDALAIEIYQYTGSLLGEACANFAAFSSPEAFIFFGGLTKAGELLMAPVRESYNSHALKMYQNKPKFLISGLDDANAAVLGAAALGWEIKQ